MTAETQRSQRRRSQTASKASGPRSVPNLIANRAKAWDMAILITRHANAGINGSEDQLAALKNIQRASSDLRRALRL